MFSFAWIVAKKSLWILEVLLGLLFGTKVSHKPQSQFLWKSIDSRKVVAESIFFIHKWVKCL